MSSVYEILKGNCECTPHKIAVIHNAESLTYAELNQRVHCLAQGLSNLGITPDSSIGLIMENSLNFVTVFFALQLMGANVVPFNYRSSESEIERALQAVTCDYVIISKRFEHLSSLENAGTLDSRHIIYEQGSAGKLSLHNILENAQNTEINPALFTAGAPHTYALTLFTSGTTGTAKAAVHTHAGLSASVAQMLWNTELFSAETVYLNYAPLFHFGGMSAMLQTLGIGGTLILIDNFRPPEVLAAIMQYRVTHVMLLPPSVCFKLAQEQAEHCYDLSSVLATIVSGGELTHESAQCLFSLFPHTLLINGYSQTESAIRLVNRISYEDYLENPERIHSVGIAQPGCEIRLIAENGEEVLPGECGEPWGRSEYMLDHYLEGEAFVDGWFPTGDLMRQDAKGYYYFMGRKKDVIKSGGENVYAFEVEEVIGQCEAVQHVAVVGLPDRDYGEIVAAVIVKKPGRQLDEQEVIDLCRGSLAGYKKPRKVFFVDHLPQETTGKLSKTKIREQLSSAPQDKNGGKC